MKERNTNSIKEQVTEGGTVWGRREGGKREGEWGEEEWSGEGNNLQAGKKTTRQRQPIKRHATNSSVNGDNILQYTA